MSDGTLAGLCTIVAVAAVITCAYLFDTWMSKVRRRRLVARSGERAFRHLRPGLLDPPARDRGRI